jgi:RNA polymerase sigma-70 factor (ECF subfamily)
MQLIPPVMAKKETRSDIPKDLAMGDHMASIFQQVKISGYATLLRAVAPERVEKFQAVFQENRHRIYALAFWMTDNELAAEELMRLTFCRGFAHSSEPTAEALDGALISELREQMPIGVLTVDEGICCEAPSVRHNTLRIHLERAVVQLPPTERMIFLLHDVEGYDHARIVRTLGVSEDESRIGLHQARLRMRNLLAKMVR